MPDERQPGPDETRPMPAVDETAADATQVGPGPSPGATRSGDAAAASTRPMSPVGDWDPDPRGADDAAWTGRAAVRPPGPDENGYADGDWSIVAPEEEATGRWWMPIVVGIVGVTLLALLATGIYLIVRNSRAGVDTPQPTPTQTVTRTVTTAATTEPTTAATTEPTFSAVPTTEPAATEATVPALRGMPVNDAKAALARSGLSYRVILRPSDAEPGTVIDSDPPEGQVVPADTRITLVVAAERTDGPATATTVPTGGATTGP
ncbi:PASTA domain-containing protein [Actinoplanes oblitus]|uniref:PASTA domain-containing protein n=1 Tax=Actinoplanes oblitus TaxID=3040509 RepID=A0ABY8WFK5_9ACTN|nr:Stk1 family PASTA domain-containing Ser/Thr kinase [Actinoplanes oblitus]WIM96595.1 PASTA domain-containing protein [Actinoplanes oblitus]